MVPAEGAPPAYAVAPTGAVTHQQMVTTMQPAPVVAGTSSQRRSGNWKCVASTGIAQVVLGSLTAILGIVSVTAVAQTLFYDNHGSPIWFGLLFYGVAGILGITSGCMKSSRLAVGYMVMSILACFASCAVFAYSCTGLVIYGVRCQYTYTYYDFDARWCNPQVMDLFRGVHFTLIILAIAEFIVAIVGASMTCFACCNNVQHTQTLVHYQAVPQVVVPGQPQIAMVYHSPVVQPQPVYQPQQVTPQGPMPAGYQYPQVQAPPTGAQQYQQYTK